MSFIPPIFQKLKILIPSSQACLVFDEKVIDFFYKQWSSLFHFIHLASNLYIFIISLFSRRVLQLIVTDWAIAEDLRLVDGLILWWYDPWHHLTQPFTSELKWLAAGDSELTFLLQEKKWPKEKKKPEHHFNQIQL